MAVLRFRWNGTALIPADGASVLPLYVADSWLVEDGRVVALDDHFSRFARSAAAQGLVRPVDAFVAAVEAALPRTGSFFPRIDLTERGELELWIRPTPPLFDSMVLRNAESDVRTEPAIKGPDIVALEELREKARANGADDAVIVNAEGQIVDGATTCLLWWRNGELFMPPAEAIRVDSITVKVIRRMAAEQGIFVSEESATPADLSGLTLWALNALHGIRQVTAWIDGPELVTDEKQLLSWRASYSALATPLTAA